MIGALTFSPTITSMFVFYQSDLEDGIAIAYIDVKDGLCDGHIRCMDAHSAKLIMSQNMDGFGFTLLSGKFLYQKQKIYYVRNHISAPIGQI